MKKHRQLGIYPMAQILFIALKLLFNLDITWVQVFIPTYLAAGWITLIVLVAMLYVVLTYIRLSTKKKA